MVACAILLASLFAEPLAVPPAPRADVDVPTHRAEPAAAAAPSPSVLPDSPSTKTTAVTPDPAARSPAPSQVDPEPSATRRPKISLPANNDVINNAPEDPSHNVGVAHEGPEPLERDPCRIPLYFRGIERRQNLQAENMRRIYVRVTVEGYTSTWLFRPLEEDQIYIAAWRHLDTKRVFKDSGGGLNIKVGSLQLGGATLGDVELRFGLQPMGGGVFGRGLMERFGMDVDWEKGVGRVERCGGSEGSRESPAPGPAH